MQYQSPESAAVRIRAAQYVRMSTEHQQYSIENQSEAIALYAQAHGMQVIRTYADAGKSGLTFQERAALKRLITDVETGVADFTNILVYDVSRWGRFQDADESAYYEYICKRANIDVHYCAEPFVNDGSLPSTLLKTIKRTMAGEYSRELSAKCFAGKCRLVERGFRQGGSAGYGLRRLLIDQHGNAKGLLGPGERKSIFTDRVILVPGPAEEIDVVNEIFRRFVEQRHSPGAIAADLNARGVLGEYNRRWSRSMLRDLLSNPKYIGANVSNRLSYKLKQKRVRNPPEMWIRRDNAFQPIVSAELFARAQAMIKTRNRHFTDDELLEALRVLLREAGFLSKSLVSRTRGMPSSFYYESRFKGMLGAYRQIGYTPPTNFTFIAETERFRTIQQKTLEQLQADLAVAGATVERDVKTDLMTINGGITARLLLVRCTESRYRGHRWIIRLTTKPVADITIAARLASGNETILDYYLFPAADHLPERIDVGEHNSFVWDVYRFADLHFFLELCT